MGSVCDWGGIRSEHSCGSIGKRRHVSRNCILKGRLSLKNQIVSIDTKDVPERKYSKAMKIFHIQNRTYILRYAYDVTAGTFIEMSTRETSFDLALRTLQKNLEKWLWGCQLL